MGQREKTQERVFNVTHEEVGATFNVVAGTLLLKSHYIYALIDPRSNHLFVSRGIST